MTLKHLTHTMAAALLTLLVACATPADETALYNKGVSIELAEMRKAEFTNVNYNLFFYIPENKTEDIIGTSNISLTLAEVQPVIIDFRADSSQVKNVIANGEKADYYFKDEHIVIGESSVKTGINDLEIQFVASDESLKDRKSVV